MPHPQSGSVMASWKDMGTHSIPMETGCPGLENRRLQRLGSQSTANTVLQRHIGLLARHCSLCPSLEIQGHRRDPSPPHLGPGARKGGDTFRFWGRRLKGHTYYRTTSKMILTGRGKRNTHSVYYQYPHFTDEKLKLQSLWESHTTSKKCNFRTLDTNVLLHSSFCSPHPARNHELGNPREGDRKIM